MSEQPLLTPEPTITRILRGPNAQLGKQTVWVLARCAREPDGYWCNAHQFFTDKRSIFAAHCREPGDHHVAISCSKHGLEEPLEKNQ